MLLNNVCNKVKEQISKRLLREKCPNTKYLSIFSPNAGKYGPEKTPHLDTFHAVGSNKKTPNISLITDMVVEPSKRIVSKFCFQC